VLDVNWLTRNRHLGANSDDRPVDLIRSVKAVPHRQ
jgi:hypothetical protein